MNPQRPPEQHPQQQEHTSAHCSNEEPSLTSVKKRSRNTSAKSSSRVTLRTLHLGHSLASPTAPGCRLTPWSIYRQSTQDTGHTAHKQSVGTPLSVSEVSSAAAASSVPSSDSVLAVAVPQNTSNRLRRQHGSSETFDCNLSSPQGCAQPEENQALSVPIASLSESVTVSGPLELYTSTQLQSDLFCCAARAAAAAEAALTVENPPELLTPCRTVRRHYNLLQQITIQIEALHGILHLYKDLKLGFKPLGSSASSRGRDSSTYSSSVCNDSSNDSIHSNRGNGSSGNGLCSNRCTDKLWPFLFLLQEQMHLSYGTLLQTTNLLPSLLHEALRGHSGLGQTSRTEPPQHQQKKQEEQPEQFLQHLFSPQNPPTQCRSPALRTRSSKRLASLAEKKAADVAEATAGFPRTTAVALTSRTAIVKTPVEQPAIIAATPSPTRSVVSRIPLQLSQSQQLLLHLKLNKQHEGVLKALCEVLDSYLEKHQSTGLRTHQHFP